jgi:hypothetical protein
MLDFFWNLHQQRQIADATSTARTAKQEATEKTERLRELEFTIQRMALASQALWEILRDRLGIPESELLAKMEEIDLRDEVADQRITHQVNTCPQCQRKIGARHPRCHFCGAAAPKPHVFQ